MKTTFSFYVGFGSFHTTSFTFGFLSVLLRSVKQSYCISRRLLYDLQNVKKPSAQPKTIKSMFLMGSASTKPDQVLLRQSQLFVKRHSFVQFILCEKKNRKNVHILQATAPVWSHHYFRDFTRNRFVQMKVGVRTYVIHTQSNQRHCAKKLLINLAHAWFNVWNNTFCVQNKNVNIEEDELLNDILQDMNAPVSRTIQNINRSALQYLI